MVFFCLIFFLEFHEILNMSENACGRNSRHSQHLIMVYLHTFATFERSYLISGKLNR